MKENLESLRESIFELIEVAAIERDGRRTIQAQSLLVEHGQCVEQLTKLEKSIADLQARIFDGGLKPPPKTRGELLAENMAPPAPKSEVSPREAGRVARSAVLRDLIAKRIPIIQKDASTFRARDGHEIGVAFATENPPEANRWFLGLRPDRYQSVILICAKDDEANQVFGIPAPVYESLEPRLSRDAHGQQVKFNVRMEDGQYVLTVPDGDSLKLERLSSIMDDLRRD